MKNNRNARGTARWALAAALPWAVACAFADEPALREKIEVTGSNIRKVEGETALPVTTVSREEIARSGVTTAGELLDKLPYTNAGAHPTAVGVGDGNTPGMASTSLRGLGGQDTLILLNGRRISQYAFNSLFGSGAVNLNQIPVAAIERVEILRDGASAIYGTDAIGGVVNFILRKDYRGAEVTAYGARTEGGGGNSQKYTASVGLGDISTDRYNVMVVLDYQKDLALAASQRPFASTAIRPDLDIARTSGNPHPANFFAPNLGRNRYNVTAAQGCMPSAGSFQVALDGQPAPSLTFCRYDFTSVLEIYPPATRKGVFARGAFQVADDHQAFVEYHRGWNSILFASSETPVNDFNGNGPFLYPANGPYYPTTVTLPDGRVVRPSGDLTINWRLKDAGLRTDRIEADESRVLAGMRGTLAGWDYDAAAIVSRSHASDNYEAGWVRESAMRAAIATGLIDVFSGRPQTREAQALIDAAVIHENIRDSDARVSSIDARVSRELTSLANGPLALAAGVEYRKEEVEERPKEVLYSGDILSYGGAQPPTTHADRTVTSVFAELNVPIARNLEAQLAVRHDRFSDFGGTTNPKVAIRWNPAQDFLARASFGTGFRAPTLNDMFLPLAGGAFTGDQWLDQARCPGGQPLGDYVSPDECGGAGFPVRYGGNAALQPETSRQWSFGVVYEPMAGTSVGLDYWAIHRRNSIQFVYESTIFEHAAVVDPLTAGGRFVRRARDASGGCVGDGDVPTPANIPCAIDYVLERLENLGKYTVSGMDVSLAWRGNAPWDGRLSARLDGTYIIQYVYQIESDGAYFNNAGRSADNGAVPRWKHYASIDWKRGAWTATLAQTFILGYHDYADETMPARRVASYETYDALVSWEPRKGITMGLGVRNMLDRAPPASRQANNFQVGYDPVFTDPRGRTWYFSVKATIK